MNRAQILDYIAHPEKLDKDSLPVLKDLVRQFPYCQTAQLLLIKCLHNESSIHYGAQLKIAAAFASDRKVLYRLINNGTDKLHSPQPAPESETITTHSAKAAEKPVAVTNESPAAVGKMQSVPEPKTIPPPAPDLPQTGKLSPREVLERRLKEIEEAKFRKDKKSTSEAVKPAIPAGDTSVESSIPPAIEKSRKVKPAVKDEEQKAVQKPGPEMPVAGPPKPEPVLKPAARTRENTVEPSESKGEAESAEPEMLTFSEWLKRGKAAKPRKPSTGKVTEQSAIIDRFISEEPRISPPKKEFFNPANMARMSLHEYDDLITETLAKIYFDQGNYQKALSAYEKLILLHPEKSLTFAAQIKAIQKIISQK